MSHRILLMDDEPAICEITGILLKKLGYEPVITMKGEETIEEYKKAMEAGAPVDLVILDLSVPGGMGGREVIKKLLEIDPTVKSLVSSGDLSDPAINSYSEYGFTGVLTKPYNKAGLDLAIKSVLALENQ